MEPEEGLIPREGYSSQETLLKKQVIFSRLSLSSRNSLLLIDSEVKTMRVSKSPNPSLFN